MIPHAVNVFVFAVLLLKKYLCFSFKIITKLNHYMEN